jgi:hypothetical protein
MYVELAMLVFNTVSAAPCVDNGNVNSVVLFAETEKGTCTKAVKPAAQ